MCARFGLIAASHQRLNYSRNRINVGIVINKVPSHSGHSKATESNLKTALHTGTELR